MNLYVCENKSGAEWPWRVRDRDQGSIVLGLFRTEREANDHIKQRIKWEKEKPRKTSKQPIFDSADYDTNPH